MTTQRIQLRRGTAADWTAVNPVLAAGEPGYETDTGFVKVGNGANAWTTLPYLATGGAGGPGGGDGGDADTVRGVTPSDVGLSVLGAADQAAGRNALGVTWANLPGRPGVLAQLAPDVDAPLFRSVIGAVDSIYVGQQVSNLQADIADAGYVTAAGLLPSRPFKPLTGNYNVPKSSTTPTATGVRRTDLEAGKMYRFRIELDYDMPSAADMKIKFSGPAGATIRVLAQGPLPASSNAGAWYGVDINDFSQVANFGGFSAAPTATALGGATTRILIEGQITLGATAGALELMAAQVTAQDLMGAVLPASSFDIVECAPAAA